MRERLYEGSIANAPNLCRLIDAGGGDELAVGTEGGAIHFGCVSEPMLHLCVEGSRGMGARTTEGQGEEKDRKDTAEHGRDTREGGAKFPVECWLGLFRLRAGSAEEDREFDGL